MAIDEIKSTRKDLKQLLMACATLDRMHKKLEERIEAHETMAKNIVPVLQTLIERMTRLEEIFKLQ